MTNITLETRNLTRRFGALAAIDDVSIAFEKGALHAIIGPNGAGKTTLINLLSGDLAPSDGTIHFKGRDITHAPAHRTNRAGVGRSYQKTNIFPDFSCFENCWLGAAGRMGHALRFLRPAEDYQKTNREAADALKACGLDQSSARAAGALSHGEQRQLEIAMTLATGPELLLLDEPLAGMGGAESRDMVALMKRLARDHTVVLVEHDMDAVFSLAEKITVLDGGRVLATGTPDEIKSNRLVQDAYLGLDRGEPTAGGRP